jgi:hypothetical protein
MANICINVLLSQTFRYFLRGVYLTVFNFLCAVQETLYCGAKDIAASIHITWRAPVIVQVDVNISAVYEMVTTNRSW